MYACVFTMLLLIEIFDKFAGNLQICTVQAVQHVRLRLYHVAPYRNF